MAFPDGTADFRSDTVTRPTPAMRRAMAEAEVGDDVYGEDPTVNALEEEAAAALGMEAGMFVPSGSMANLIGINVGTQPGDEVLCVATAHVRNYEAGSAAAVSGVGFRIIGGVTGHLEPDDVTAAIKGTDYHHPQITMLTMENTHNVSGGTVMPAAAMVAAAEAARAAGLGVHLDGARLWNAVAATGSNGVEMAAMADTAMFCFSKGLGAPVGSILCGSAATIDEARRLRKRFGGGMRQVGVIAAAARVGLRDRDRLGQDHVLAARLGDGLADRWPDAVDAAQVQTNMVLVGEEGLGFSVERLREALAAAGVLVGLIEPGVLRFCTHYDVDGADVDRVFAVADALARETAQTA
jgi:threonine aldolase